MYFFYLKSWGPLDNAAVRFNTGLHSGRLCTWEIHIIGYKSPVIKCVLESAITVCHTSKLAWRVDCAGAAQWVAQWLSRVKRWRAAVSSSTGNSAKQMLPAIGPNQQNTLQWQTAPLRVYPKTISLAFWDWDCTWNHILYSCKIKYKLTYCRMVWETLIDMLLLTQFTIL